MILPWLIHEHVISADNASTYDIKFDLDLIKVFTIETRLENYN